MPILEKSMVFTYDTLNIFTDASVDGIFSAPGYIAYYGNEPCHALSKWLLNSTNNEGEVYAIKMALLYAANFPQVKNINIFSDSLITVNGLNDWIKNWIKNVRSGKMYSSSGMEVANQSIFLDCIKIITYYNINVRFYHVDGHKDCNNKRHVQKFMNDFQRDNHINLDMAFAMFLMKCNSDIDRFTRDQLLIGKKVALDCKRDYLFKSVYSDNIDFEKYFKLIGRSW